MKLISMSENIRKTFLHNQMDHRHTPMKLRYKVGGGVDGGGGGATPKSYGMDLECQQFDPSLIVPDMKG